MPFLIQQGKPASSTHPSVMSNISESFRKQGLVSVSFIHTSDVVLHACTATDTTICAQPFQ